MIKRMEHDKKNDNKKRRLIEERILLIGCLLVLVMFFFFSIVRAVPQGATGISQTANETRGNTAGAIVNISGGYISTLSVNATTQNTRWKAHVGTINGKLTLDDSSGSTIYDWVLTNLTGEVYAVRNSTTPTWANAKCANASLLETENFLMNHTNAQDNLTATFNTSSGATHGAFYAGTVSIGANTCPTLNTYKNNVTQDVDFEEIALSDSANFTAGGNVIYATILEQDVAGFDAVAYDFQLLLPENGLPTWTGATAYYIYVELT